MNSILLGILVVAGIMTASAYAVTSISDISHASTMSNEIDIEKKSESMNAYFDGDVIHVKNTGKYDSEIAMFRFYDEPGTEVHRTIIPDTEGRVFGGAVSVVKNTALTSGDAFLQSHIPNSYTLDDIGIGSLAELSGEIVTKRGRVFPISFDEWTNQNGAGIGDGKALTDGLGVYLAIQHIDTNGKVYFGSGNNPGSQTDIRQYVGVGNNVDWAIAITDDDVFETLVVPEFGKEYVYSSGSLIDVTNPSPNILGYSSSKIMSGTPSISTDNDGITISGTGTIVMKLDSYSDGTFIRGTLNNADVKIVTSPLDLTTISMSGNKYVIYKNTSPPISLTNTVEAWKPRECRINGGCWGGYNFNTYYYSITSTPNIIVASDSDLSSTFNYNFVYNIQDHSCAGKNSPGCFVNVPHFFTGSLNTVVSSRSTTDGLLVTSLSSPYVSTARTSSPEPSVGPLRANANTAHTLLSTAPWNEQYSFDNNFEQYTELSNNSYLVANLNDGNVVIKGENFNPDTDAFFQVYGLPSDIAYDITKNGITGVIKKTSSTGEISLSHDDVDFGIATSPGGILKIYPDSAKYLGSINNVAMLDVYNVYSVPLYTGTNLVYIPQDFVRLVFPVAVEIENVSVDNTPLNDLNKNYAKNEALMIPVIPGGETIYATINGEDVEVLMRYVSAPTQMKQVPQKSSTSSDHSTSGIASASSNISTSTFLTATHDGMMGVNLDLKVGGSADYTMDSSFTGPNYTGYVCQDGIILYKCGMITSDQLPTILSDIDSLTSAHQRELVASLNNGQVSKLTVEVDIFRNMQHVDTKLIYRGNPAQASITSTLSEAGFGASNQVRVTYPLTSISDNVAIPVTAGDMMEFVVRVNLQASGVPTPSSSNAAYSSYVQVTTEFGGGVITVGMF